MMTVPQKPTLMQSQASLPKKVAVTMGLMTGLLLFVYFFSIPNPNMILIAGLVFCSALFGFGGGIVAAAIMVVYTLFFFSTHHCFTHFTPENLQKVFVSLIGALADMLFVCLLKRTEVQAFEKVALLTDELRRENRLLHSMSMTDALTGIRNRMALHQDYDFYRNCEATVMMLDLNQFKVINDTLGHGEGDRILKETGQLLAETFGAEHCYRYGGDEFLVIIPDLSESEFHERLERLMESRPTLTMEGKTSRVGYSVGYVRAHLTQPDTLRQLMAGADERMYQVKRDGADNREDKSRMQAAQKKRFGHQKHGVHG